MIREAKLFELELFGGSIEKRYRKARPEVEAMPWGTIDTSAIAEADLLLARQAWTTAAFQEYRTGIACAATLRALIECAAPLDLVAVATRFPLDEMVHVELCARMAMELGGGTDITHDPLELVLDADPELSALMRAADLIVRNFCVGESLSIPLLRGTWKASKHPLPRAVLGRIVKDEALHGTFGFAFLDWAEDRLSEADRMYLGKQADSVIHAIHEQWAQLRSRPTRPIHDGDALAWMESTAYLELADRSMRDRVVRPLLQRNIPVTAHSA
jgi:hypothetical protein